MVGSYGNCSGATAEYSLSVTGALTTPVLVDDDANPFEWLLETTHVVDASGLISP